MSRIVDPKVEFKTTKLAKEVGFKNGSNSAFIEYIGTYVYDDDPDHHESYKAGDIHESHVSYIVNNEPDVGDYSNKNYTMYEQPTQMVLKLWLLQQNIHIELQFSRTENDKSIEWWFYLYSNHTPGNWHSRIKFFPDEIGRNLNSIQALEIGLREGLEVLKKKEGK